MGKAVGIDLGTTNSVVAVMEGGKPTVVINNEGSRLTPSVVAFTKTGERLVGQIARRQAVLNPENTIYSAKRFIGRRYGEVQSEIKNVPYKVVAGPNDAVRFEIQGKLYAPEEISAQVLRKLADDAGKYLGEKVTDAVITVPAYFNDAQRTSTKDAGKIAGLNVLRIINEPTAAALAYGLDKKGNETVMVFDLGGGTFDVSILEVGEGVFEVKATAGDTHLGGDDFDKRIVDWLAEEFKRDQGIDLRADRQSLQRLTEAAEKAKTELSTVTEATISLPFITADASGPKHLEMKLSRAKFDQLTADLVERCVGPVKQALQDAKLIERNTTIPARRSEVFSTAENNQTAVDIHVLQGERELARDNRTLGHFRLEGLAPAPRGLPQIEVSFDSHADEDRRRREEVDARNHADAIAYQVERQISELGDRAPANERARAEAMINEVREMVKSQSPDVARLRQLTSDLQQLASGLASATYTRAAAGGGQGPGGQGTQERGPDDVIDAEFKPRS